MTTQTDLHKPTIWMNVTTSANWNRPVVGIVRVEQELLHALSRIYGTDHFDRCIFEGGEFVPYDDAAAQFDRAEERPFIWPDSSRHIPKSSTFDPVFGRAQWQSRPAQPQSNSAAVLGTYGYTAQRQIKYGDIILSVGLDWDYPYVNKFQTLKDTMGIKVVTCCYDLIPIIFPQYCLDHVSDKFKDYYTKISWSSSLILCISESSRDDYVEFAKKVGAPEVETVVIPLGDNVPDQVRLLDGTQAADDDEALSVDVQRAAEQPFVLFVSTIERRKNHEVLYRAYHLLAAAGHADRLPKLVFVGMAGWGVDNLLKDIELDPLTKGLIIQLNHVSDRELSYLYEKAYFCAYPSLYEGWGLPIGEALACGKAVIASAQGSIPEVGGDLVTYLDPWNPQAWADEILMLADNPEQVAEREAQVRKRYKTRTWTGTANVVKTMLDRLRNQRDVAITLYPGYDLYTMTGTHCGETMRSTGVGGPLTHGPYHSLPPGAYEVEITVDKLEGEAGQAFVALRANQGTKEFASLRIDFDEREHFGVIARMTKIQLHQQVDDYEIYTEVTPNLLLSINKINIVGQMS